MTPCNAARCLGNRQIDRPHNRNNRLCECPIIILMSRSTPTPPPRNEARTVSDDSQNWSEWWSLMPEDRAENLRLWRQRIVARHDQWHAAMDDHRKVCPGILDPHPPDVMEKTRRLNAEGLEILQQRYLWHLAAGLDPVRAQDVAMEMTRWEDS